MGAQPRIAAITAFLAVAACTQCAVSQAATVSADPAGTDSTVRFIFDAAPGEANQVRFEVEPTKITVSDTGADLTVGAGCTAQGPRRAVCATAQPSFFLMDVALGDRDDGTVFAPIGDGEAVRPAVDAGAGNDSVDASGLSRIVDADGGEGDDTLIGGAADDNLTGGPGNDSLAGNAGDDRLLGDVAGAMGNDVLDGGAGSSDEVSYADRTEGVTVSLAGTGPQGGEGESDTLAEVENLAGGSGDDVLTGSDAANRIAGRSGHDVIAGLGGNDVLTGAGVLDASFEEIEDGTPDVITGGDGHDLISVKSGGSASGGAGIDQIGGVGAKLSGGPGPDRLYPEGGTATCGGGTDSVGVKTEEPVRIRSGCESVSFGRFGELRLRLPITRTKRSLLARVTCADIVQDVIDDPEETPGGDAGLCATRLRVFRRGTLVARRGFDLDPEQGRLLRMRRRHALGKPPSLVRVRVKQYAVDLSL